MVYLLVRCLCLNQTKNICGRYCISDRIFRTGVTYCASKRPHSVWYMYNVVHRCIHLHLIYIVLKCWTLLCACQMHNISGTGKIACSYCTAVGFPVYSSAYNFCRMNTHLRMETIESLLSWTAIIIIKSHTHRTRWENCIFLQQCTITSVFQEQTISSNLKFIQSYQVFEIYMFIYRCKL